MGSSGDNGMKDLFFKNSISLRIFSFLLIIVIWEVAALLVQSRVLPGPLVVLEIFWGELFSGEMLFSFRNNFMESSPRFLYCHDSWHSFGNYYGGKKECKFSFRWMAYTFT